jgi:hypothetical protein
MLYLTISEGPNPATAKPYLATADQKIIRAVAKELATHLGAISLNSTTQIVPLDRNLQQPSTDKPKS